MNMVKYPGGKERELDVIRKFLPTHINNYYEPFVGGGAVYLDMDALHYYVNDFSADLMTLYKCVASQDSEFFASMMEINNLWKSIDDYVKADTKLFSIYVSYRDGLFGENKLTMELTKYMKKHREDILSFIKPMNCGGWNDFISNLVGDFVKKFVRMKELNFSKKVISDEDICANILGVFKAAFYVYIRSLYSHMGHYTDGFKAMLYLFIRDFCYSSMFRFNADGEFNVPYGGISYNGKTYDKVFEKYQSNQILNHTLNTTFGCMDYRDFLDKYPPGVGDFMFVDPPYDSSFSTYDRNSFDAEEQRNLADYLLNKCECNFMLDIRYTDFIASLYPTGYKCKNGGEIRIESFDKNYSVSFMNRNAKKFTHILVMNY